MERKKFTIDNIEQCLNELDFKWIDRYVLVGKNYEHAKLSYFKGKPVSIFVQRNDQCRVVILTVSNKEFIISSEGARLNASESWQDLINSANVQV